MMAVLSVVVAASGQRQRLVHVPRRLVVLLAWLLLLLALDFNLDHVALSLDVGGLVLREPAQILDVRVRPRRVVLERDLDLA
jgi:hypothetical protein